MNFEKASVFINTSITIWPIFLTTSFQKVCAIAAESFARLAVCDVRMQAA